MPALTEIFSECFMPDCGISIHPSASFITSASTPLTSFPKTSASGVAAGENRSSITLLSACSMAITVYPSFRRASTASRVVV